MEKELDMSEKPTLEELRAGLAAVAETSPSGSRSVYSQIVELLPEIEMLKSKHRTDAEIVTELKKLGLEISLGTFTQYRMKAIRMRDGTKSLRKSKMKANSSKTVSSVVLTPSETASRPASGGKTSSALGHKISDSDL